MTKLPDGSYIPNLNGVKEPMVWTGADFSPITGISVTEQGVEWWVHENGIQSTTAMVEGTVNGVTRRQAVLYVARPLAGENRKQKTGARRR